MLNEKIIRDLINDLCFTLDCRHFNFKYTSASDPKQVSEWLKELYATYPEIAEGNEKCAINREDAEWTETWGKAYSISQKIQANIQEYHNIPLPELDEDEIKEVYIKLVNGDLHPQVLALEDGGYELADKELVEEAVDEYGNTATEFRDVTSVARNRGFIEGIIRKYKPSTTTDLLLYFRRPNSAIKKKPKTLI